LCDPAAIRQRQDAVEAMTHLDAKEFVNKATGFLKSLPDLERLLQKLVARLDCLAYLGLAEMQTSKRVHFAVFCCSSVKELTLKK
jgi:DNA mismatch repair ATPase MutS